MYNLLLETTDDINKALAKRLQNIRKRRKITQKQLAERSNVSYATLRKFEKTGEISLRSLTKIAAELGLINEINELFTRPVYLSIEEVIRDGKVT
ncbi:MAG: helix-turn-helix domain-containing protein [Lachnospiraceae bacterium]|nr:helix-turn-helix domain-containing protein [Lachnospiraceae bacterium]